MRYAIPMLADRVAPRCTGADTLVIVTLRGEKIAAVETISLAGDALSALLHEIAARDVDVLVCGGMERKTRASLESQGVTVFDNVACSTAELFSALAQGTICAGFGFVKLPAREAPPETEGGETFDCLACSDRACLRGAGCKALELRSGFEPPDDVKRVLEAALDVSLEKERTLCRLSELVYFCLEMGYRRIGLAFCIELLDQVEMLVRLLRRFFEVIPVCCKVGGVRDGGGSAGPVACNPFGQAEILNNIGTEFNVLVGLCLGMDSIFQRASAAPSTTLIVKDKSLAHNPIGALYSEYYLKEVARTSVDAS